VSGSLRVDQLARRCDVDPARLLRVLDTEVEAGRLERDRTGRYAINVTAFDASTLRAVQISVTRLGWDAEDRNARRRVVRQERSCAVCGETFTPPRCDGHYCSKACRPSAYRQRLGAST
jgi:hypothetical protein